VSFVANIVDIARENDDYRRVVHTGERSQLVVMAIPEGGEIGEERHDAVQQSLFIMEGDATAILDGKPSALGPGDVLVVTPGTTHNVRNTGLGALRIVTVYAPPNHIDGRVHRTKADADADMEDEEFGQGAWRRA